MKSQELFTIIKERVAAGESRAVLRFIQQNESAETVIPECPGCDQKIKYRAESTAKRMGEAVVKVVCNIYEDGRWKREEDWHDTCYHDAGDPYGEVLDGREAGRATQRSKSEATIE